MSIARKATGGPAFPGGVILDQRNEEWGCPKQEGMLLRDYLAVHAPKDVPAWFEPKMPAYPARPEPPTIGEGKHATREACVAWGATFSAGDKVPSAIIHDTLIDYECCLEDCEGGGEGITEVLDFIHLSDNERLDLIAWEQDFKEFLKKQREYRDRYFQQRVVQWPWYYADRVLEARSE